MRVQVPKLMSKNIAFEIREELSVKGDEVIFTTRAKTGTPEEVSRGLSPVCSLGTIPGQSPENGGGMSAQVIFSS